MTADPDTAPTGPRTGPDPSTFLPDPRVGRPGARGGIIDELGEGAGGHFRPEEVPRSLGESLVGSRW
ncbi:hypothetical protein BH23VER1_BH23VER1_19190 [soil metagenome]